MDTRDWRDDVAPLLVGVLPSLCLRKSRHERFVVLAEVVVPAHAVDRALIDGDRFRPVRLLLVVVAVADGDLGFGGFGAAPADMTNAAVPPMATIPATPTTRFKRMA